jgi:uncharacterized protein YpmB
MKTKTTLLTLALSLTAAAVCFAQSPQMGTWKLNEAKSSIPAGMGKNTTVTYSAKGDKTKVMVQGVDKDGKPTHSVWVGKFDGKVYPVKGNLPYNQLMYKMVNDRTNDITAMKDGKMVWSGVITVARDGKSRTVIINSTDAKGKKSKARYAYDRQ